MRNFFSFLQMHIILADSPATSVTSVHFKYDLNTDIQKEVIPSERVITAIITWMFSKT